MLSQTFWIHKDPTTEVFDLSAKSWVSRRITFSPGTGGRGTCTAQLNGRMYIFGGTIRDSTNQISIVG